MARATAAPLSRGKKLLFASLTVVTFWVGLEALCTVLGVRPVASHADPFVGFSETVPLTVAVTGDDGRRVRVTAPGKRVWFNDQAFPERKPEGTFRIICVGGSTTFGRPYDDATSFCGWLREMLPAVDPTRRWEVINAGGISYASYRVAIVMDELAEFEPDLFIVLTGHNEFLEHRTYADLLSQSWPRRRLTAALSRTRTWALLDRCITPGHADVAVGDETANADGRDRLPAEVDERLNHTIGPEDYHRDDPWKAGVLEHFRVNLRRMVAIAERARARIVFITPAANEKDCAPFKSQSTGGVAADLAALPFEQALPFGQVRPFDQARPFGQARPHVEDDELSAADELARAVRRDPRHAGLRFELGRMRLRSGEHDAAANEFRAAIDEDVCPLRAITEITQAIREVGRQSSLGVVDFEDLLRREGIRRNGHPCLGDEFFLDHVHPNVEVHGWLAIWILDHLQAARIVGGRPLRFDRSDPIWDSVSERVQARLTPEYVAVAMRNLAKVFHWAGKFEEAETYARRGLEVLPEDPESRFVLADCLTNLGRPHAALEEYGRLYPTVDRFPRGYLPYAELLKHAGDYQQAKAFATLAIAYRPENAYRYRLLGEIHLALAEWELAAESLTLADRLRPDDPETWLRLAEAHLGSGDTQAAIRRYRQVVAIRPDDPTARYRLAMALLKSSEAAAAAEQLRLVLRQDPEHPLANAALRAVDASHPAAGSAAAGRDPPAATAPRSP